jgi:uncharacterized tellurite resistance protein B-like protein
MEQALAAYLKDKRRQYFLILLITNLMNTTGQLLEGHSDIEKGAYLSAIASLATADRHATEDEVIELNELCEAAGLSSEQKQMVMHATSDLEGTDLNRCLDVLKNSELKYSLIADLMTFAKVDKEYSEAEQKCINKIAKYLGLNDRQKEALDNFATAAIQEKQPEVTDTSKGFLPFSAIGEKLKSSGINASGLLRGVLGFAAPMLLASMVRKGVSGINSWRSNLQGAGRGLFGGTGRLGSILGMFTGARSFATSRGWLSRALGA